MTNDSRDPGPEEFERKLRGVLSEATEGLPGNPGRYEQTETRFRRRRRLAGVAVVAAAVVLVGGGIGIPRLLSGGGGSGGDTTVATGRDSVGLSCPKPSGGPGSPKPTGGGPLVPDGAVSARFCEGMPKGKLAVAADPRLVGTTITKGADRISAALNGLQPAASNLTCRSDLGPTYDLVLGYADGRTVQVSFESYGCGVAKSGAEFRTGASELPELGLELLRSQPGAPADLTCPTDNQAVGRPDASAGSGSFVPAGATSARLCPRPESMQGPVSSQVSDVVLDAKRTESVVGKLNHLPAADPNAVCTMELGATYDLMLGYADGRELRVTFEGYGCGFAKAESEFRMNARDLATQIATLADAQRLSSPQDPPAARPECREPAKLLPGDAGMRSQLYGALVRTPDTAIPVRPVAGLLCRYSSSDGSAAELTRQERMTPEQTSQLYTALNESAGQRGVTCDWESDKGPIDIAMFSDQAGGQYELRILRGSCAALFDANGVAKASQEVRALVDQILGPR